MRTRFVSLALLSLIAACGDDAASIGPDAPLPDTADPVGTLITIDTVEPPSLVAYRLESSSTWQVPQKTSPTTFELHADEPYRVTVVCDEVQNGALNVWQEARTPDDGHAIVAGCDTQPSPYTVRGTMVQAGSVALDFSSSRSTEPNWDFALHADAKTYALVASSGDQIAVRRGIAVNRDTELSTPLDLDQEGVPLEPAALKVSSPTDDETTVARVWLELGNTMAFLHHGPIESAKLAPASILERGERQIVTVSASGPEGTRYAMHTSTAGAAASASSSVFILPGNLGPVAFDTTNDQLTATWSRLVDYDFVAMSLDQTTANGVSRFHNLNVSRAFIQATGATKATIDTASIPGFRPQWNIDMTTKYTRFLAAQTDFSSTISYGASRAEVVTGTTRALRNVACTNPSWNQLAVASYRRAACGAK